MTQDNNTSSVKQNAAKSITLKYDMGDALRNIHAEYTDTILPQYGGVVTFRRVGRDGDSEVKETIPLDFLKEVVSEWSDDTTVPDDAPRFKDHDTRQ